jgi:hypothetical protein
VKENTINLSKDLSVDKELFYGTIVKENTINKNWKIVFHISKILEFMDRYNIIIN